MNNEWRKKLRWMKIINVHLLCILSSFVLDALLKISKNGRQQLVYREHTFNRHVVRDRPNQAQTITYWRCSQFAVYRCRARCKTQNGRTYLLNESHNHDVVREPRKYGALKEIKRKISMENMTFEMKKNDN